MFISGTEFATLTIGLSPSLDPMPAHLLYPHAPEIYHGLVKDQNVSPYLHRMQAHHTDTYEHCLRVGLMCIDVALENGLDQKEMFILGAAGLLHDVGKLNIPRAVLNKTSMLEPYEKDMVSQHSLYGYQLLAGFYPEEVRMIVLCHHDFHDPIHPHITNLSTQTEITRPYFLTPTVKALAQMLAAIDMFDALSSARPYKAAMACQETENQLRRQYQGDQRYVHQVMQRCTGGC